MTSIVGHIYKITNNTTNLSYIGQCVSHFSNGRKHGYLNRWKTHIKNSKNKNDCRLLGNSINKYGENDFTITLVEICNLEELNKKEAYYINHFNTLHPNGYNLMTGGGNGRIHSEETKQKMSISRTGKKFSKETKEKISKMHQGKLVTDETRIKQSQQRKFRDMKDENKQKLEKIMSDLKIDTLPMYVIYSYNKQRDSEGFIIIKHPNLKQSQKGFMSKKETIETKYNKVLEYLKSLKASHD
jgi:group I intron endonuclease